MIIEIITGVAGAVLASYLWETKLRDHIAVSRITSSDDAAIEGFIDLYSRLFEDDGTNYSAGELLELIGTDPKYTIDRHVKAENIFLVAKFKNEVVGFIICHFYIERKKAIISYLGINENVPEAKRTAAPALENKLKSILLKHKDVCDFLFFDLQGLDPSLSHSEKSKRKGRPVLFRQTAKRLGLQSYLFHFDYMCPKVTMAQESREYPFTLMCIPIHGKLPPKPPKHTLKQLVMVPKQTVMEFLNFIYLDCYGDIYPVDDPQFKAHHDYLERKLKQYEEKLPDEIPTS